MNGNGQYFGLSAVIPAEIRMEMDNILNYDESQNWVANKEFGLLDEEREVARTRAKKYKIQTRIV